MITLSICLSLLLLAFLNAVFAQPSSDLVLPVDRELYFPPFLKSEGFYRSFLINVTFAGISTAANGFHHVTYSQFLMVYDPLLAILLNLTLGIIAAISLRSDSRELLSRQRITWVVIFLCIGVLLFVFSVSTAIPADQAISKSKATAQP